MIEWTRVVPFIAGIVFGAGIAYAVMSQMRRDLNGLGGRMARFERNTLLALMTVSEKREDREFLARMLRQE